VARFRLEFLDDGSTQEVEADDFDDDGSEIMLYRCLPHGGDPIAATTRKEAIAAFAHKSLVGPPQRTSD